MRLGNKFVPFLSLIVFFVLGIVFSEFVPKLLGLKFIILGAVVSLCCSAVLLYAYFYRFELLSKLSVSLSLFFLGCICYSYHINANYENFYSTESATEAVVFKIRGCAGSSTKFDKFYASLEKVHVDSGLESVRAGLLVYFPKGDEVEFNVGDEVIAYAKPTSIPSKLNPYEFDYKLYLSRKGIDFQLILGEESYCLWRKGRGLMNVVDRFRRKVMRKMELSMSPLGASLGKALILGDKQDLDEETKGVFQQTGSMHVLAVSGLHLGILFMFLQFLFGLPLFKKVPLLVRVVVILGVLWFYAMLSGLSVSVVRASIMFSVIQIGLLVQRKGNIYNSLLVSAFIVLCLSPRELFQVGFQLSYLAVLGIVWLHPMISRWFYFRWRWMNKVWEVIAVAIAAQCAVGILSMYYFHSFPLLFPISNLVVMLVTGIQLGLGFLFVVFHWLSPVGSIVGIMLENLFSMEVWVLDKIAGFPFCLVSDVYLKWYEMVLLYLALFGVIFVFLRRKSGVYIGILAVFLFGVVSCAQEWLYIRQEKVVLFGANDVCLTYLIGRKAYIYKEEYVNEKSFEFYVKPYLMHQGINEVQFVDSSGYYDDGVWLSLERNLICFNSKLFFLGGKKSGFLDDVPMVLGKFDELKGRSIGWSRETIIFRSDRFQSL